MTIKSTNPSNNQIIGEVNVSTEKEIKAAVAAAHQAKQAWKELGVEGRVKALKKVFDKLFEHKEQIALNDTTEMGFPITQCHDFNLGDGFNYFKWYLDNAEKSLKPEVTHEDNISIHQVYYEPYGVAAVIQPWNFPFCQWSWGVIPTLLAGNTVVFKPSEEVPLANQYLEKLINGCDLPPGVLKFIYGGGEVGDQLVHNNINLIVFTGSTKTGQYLYQVAAKKFIPALLELGGSAPCIVFADANLNQAIETIFWQRFANCGQTCDGLKRLLVENQIFDRVVTELAMKVNSSPIGDPLNKETVFGPLAADRQLKLLESQVKDAIEKGAKIITGGKKKEDLAGAYYQPTILTNINPTMRVWREEVFGPVLPIVSFKTEAEAIELANNTEYGLGSYLYTQDSHKAQRVASQIDAGMVSVNGTNYVIPQNPFGGYKQSGLGREHGKYGLHDLTQIKVIARNK
jgi:succinate-semialdehyde dehydrogenase/glutarate-semialdehyde dehydrogenase